MSFDPSTAQPVQTQAAFDPSTAQPIQTAGDSDHLPAPLAAGYVAASQLGQGEIEAAQQLGNLVKTVGQAGYDAIYGKGNILSKGIDKLSQQGADLTDAASNYLAPHTKAEQNALDAYPRLGPLARTAGYIGGSVAGGTKPTTVISNGLESALTKAAPIIGKSPVARGILSQATLGAGLGAASTPDSPLEGALRGALWGGIAGGVGGGISASLERQGNIVKFATTELNNAKIPVDSINGISTTVRMLKDNGVDMAKVENQMSITKDIGHQIMQAGPIQDLQTAPAVTLVNLAKANYPQVVAKIDALKAPLIQSQETFSAPTYNAALADKQLPIFSSALQKVMPKITANEPLTFDKLWTQRQQLDQVINAAKLKAVKNVIYKRSLPGLIQAREALTTDLGNAADSMQMRPQWEQVNQTYHDEMAPFMALKTSSTKMQSVEDVQDALTTVNKLLNPKISPNFKALNKVAKTLGPGGSDLIGQAMLINMFKGSVDNKGLINPKLYFSQMRKAEKSGLDTELWTQHTRDSAQGIKLILDGAPGAMKTGQPLQQTVGTVTKVLDYVTKNRWGIALLKTMGSSDTPKKAVRAMVQQLLTGALVLHNKTPDSSQ